MKIRVFDNIDDPFLKSEWERLETESDVFPQSTYHWCATWWKHLAGGRELHVVMVLAQEGKALGIAALCIERHVGIRVVRSFPVNYSDFFDVVVSPDTDRESVLPAVFDYLSRYHRWHAVLLTPVNDSSVLFDFARRREIAAKHLTGNVVSDISFSGWDEYVGALSRNRRRLTRKKMLELEREHTVEIELVTDSAGYASHFERIREIQTSRATKDRAGRSDVYMECVRGTNSHLFDRGQMVLYLVKADGIVISYRIGFVHRNAFYDWNTNYDISWSDYSPGLIGLAYVIRDLIAKGYATVNFMAGIYDYKISYSPKHVIRNNYLFVMGNGSLRSRLFIKYHLEWRDRIRPYYLKCKHVISRLAGLRGKSRLGP